MPHASQSSIRSRGVVAALSALALAVAAAVGPSAASAAPAGGRAGAKPTVVLVHGAFADASGWSGVVARLRRAGHPVLAPANPLRGVSADAAYLKAYLSTVRGPIVLAGHSYGGMVITNAALGNPNVKALVYVAAYAPDEGDTVSSLSALAAGGMVGPATLDVTPFPAPDGSSGQEGTIKQRVFREVFCADLPAKQAAVMARSQRPASLVALGEPSGPPAWKSIPSWYLVAGRDNTIGTAAERIMARRIGATTTEIKRSSHVVMMSHPRETTTLILRASRGR
jgi:pimeloyl-ACP methyl ester carboxylesterase